MDPLTIVGFLSHLVVGVLGYWTGRIVAERSIAIERHEPPMPHRRLWRTLQSESTRGFVLIAALFFVVVALAFQTYYWQKDIEHHDACVNRWSHEFIDTVKVRTDASGIQAQAARERDEALDSALLLAVEKDETERSKEEQAAFEVAVQNYVDAVKDLRAADRKAEKVREANPYPELRCGD